MKESTEKYREHREKKLCGLLLSLWALRFRKTIVIYFLFLSLLLSSGCGNKCEEIRKNRKPNVDFSKTGSIKGRVVFKGKPPLPRPLNTNVAACHHGHNARDENILIKDGKIQNVFVYIKEGLENSVFPIPDFPVEIDQKKCLFTPRVVGVQICQDIIFKNSDEIEHDVNSSFFNMKLLGGTHKKEHVHEKSIMLKITCQQHGWMEAFIGVLDHPCFSVTNQEGTFLINKVPAGKYKIEAWHEMFGTLVKEKEIKEKEEIELDDFIYDEKNK